jgi:hypothetical protein
MQHPLENIPSIDAERIVWEPTGPVQDPTTRLLATIYIAGCPMHLEAYRLAQDPDGEPTDIQEFAKLPENAEYTFDEEEHALFSILAAGAVETVQINGRPYALVAHPHGS